MRASQSFEESDERMLVVVGELGAEEVPAIGDEIRTLARGEEVGDEVLQARRGGGAGEPARLDVAQGRVAVERELYEPRRIAGRELEIRIGEEIDRRALP